MKEQDFKNRIVIVIRRDIEGWQAFNAATHVAAYLGKMLGEDLVTGESFISRDGAVFPRNSQYPIIIKSTENGEELNALLREARAGNILHHAFIKEMIEHTSDADIESILSTKEEKDVEIFALGIYCSNEEASRLTKKFSLWK